MAVARIARTFQVPKKGETFELRNGLVSQYAYERKEAIQKTIAAMTIGKDVSALFPDVLKNIATHDVAQKKLVYLYLMNYAKSHPDLCILAVNTFVQDSEDPNPLVRALAIRTMGCVRVDKMVSYLSEPLRKTLRDDSPYVRKTAVIGVVKLFDLNREMCVENGFLTTLQDMIADPNPMVVSNVVSALLEIHEMAPEINVYNLDIHIVKKLLSALNECSEWGRISILGALAQYRSTDPSEAEYISDRVTPQFQHVNASVVMAAIKVAFLQLDDLSDEQQKAKLIKKMTPPLVTLISSAPEVQYVALRNISLILQKQPKVLSNEIRVFFCKYNDPPYVKLQKLDVMVKLADSSNVDQLLHELKEYATEVDILFARSVVRSIGKVAFTVNSAVDRCILTLLDIVASKVPYVVQEAVIAFRDVLRTYSSSGCSNVDVGAILASLSENIDSITEAESRASLIWIIGEYSQNISNSGELLDMFLEGVRDEPTAVQLQLLTATVKYFLRNPAESQDRVQNLLKIATTEFDNPDIRDRAYIYWRLLSSNPQTAKYVILGKKPPITFASEISPSLLDELLRDLSTLASVFHKTPNTFILRPEGNDFVQKLAIEEQIQNAREDPIQGTKKGNVENLLDIDFGPSSSPTPASAASGAGSTAAGTTTNGPKQSNTISSVLDDLTDAKLQQPSGTDDLVGVFGDHNTPSNPINNLMGDFAGLNFQDAITTTSAATATPKGDDILGLL